MPARTTLTLEEIREQVGGAKMEIAVELSDDVLHGDIKGLSGRIAAIAKEHKIPDPVITKARVKKFAYNTTRYNYDRTRGQSRYTTVPVYHTVQVTCVVGYRPYTDDELLADGKKLIAAKARREKAKAKDVARIKQLAAKHGITVEA